MKTFVFTHDTNKVPVFMQDASNTCIVKCGSALTGNDSSCLNDNDFNDSISHLNKQLNEATGMHMVACHSELWDDYICFCHYRRYMSISTSMLSESTIICSPLDLNMTLAQQYACCHPLEVVKAFIEMLDDKALAHDILMSFNKSTVLYRANQFVMHRSIFVKWAEYEKLCISTLIELHNKHVINTRRYDNYQQRYFSFLYERLNSIWISLAVKNGLATTTPCEITELDIPNMENGTR